MTLEKRVNAIGKKAGGNGTADLTICMFANSDGENVPGYGKAATKNINLWVSTPNGSSKEFSGQSVEEVMQKAELLFK